MTSIQGIFIVGCARGPTVVGVRGGGSHFRRGNTVGARALIVKLVVVPGTPLWWE
jgi:hypothetical protein